MKLFLFWDEKWIKILICYVLTQWANSETPILDILEHQILFLRKLFHKCVNSFYYVKFYHFNIISYWVIPQ